MEFKEKLKERRAYEESEKAKASNEVKVAAEEAASSEKQGEEVIDGNDKNEAETADALGGRSDHSQINGELESHMQNGDCATTAPGKDSKSSIDSLESQIESREIITETITEPDLVNGECNAADQVMLVEKETPKN